MSTAPETMRREPAPDPAMNERFYRSNSRRIVGGVAGGLGEYFGVDPVWFRVGFVVAALGGGSGILVYLIMWLIVPARPEGHPEPSGPRGAVPGAAVVGMVLMAVGTIALVNTIAPWLGQYFWPVLFVVGGLALVMGGINRDAAR